MEPIFALTIIFGSIIVLTKMVLDHRRGQALHGSSTEASLGTGELKRLIREAVEEGVLPLSERLERLEDESSSEPGRLAGRDTALLEESTAATAEERPD